MPRNQAIGDFTVDVEGIGTFHFGRRSPRDVYLIRGEYARLTDGNYDDEGNYADISALGFATIKVLAVRMPDGFNLDSLDPLVDEDWESKVMKVFTALREKELSFRPGSRAASQEAGEGAAA